MVWKSREHRTVTFTLKIHWNGRFRWIHTRSKPARLFQAKTKWAFPCYCNYTRGRKENVAQAGLAVLHWWNVVLDSRMLHSVERTRSGSLAACRSYQHLRRGKHRKHDAQTFPKHKRQLRLQCGRPSDSAVSAHPLRVARPDKQSCCSAAKAKWRSTSTGSGAVLEEIDD